VLLCVCLCFCIQRNARCHNPQHLYPSHAKASQLQPPPLTQTSWVFKAGCWLARGILGCRCRSDTHDRLKTIKRDAWGVCVCVCIPHSALPACLHVALRVCFIRGSRPPALLHLDHRRSWTACRCRSPGKAGVLRGRPVAGAVGFSCCWYI